MGRIDADDHGFAAREVDALARGDRGASGARAADDHRGRKGVESVFIARLRSSKPAAERLTAPSATEIWRGWKDFWAILTTSLCGSIYDFLK